MSKEKRGLFAHLIHGNKNKPLKSTVPTGAVYVETDSQGYPVYHGEVEKFRARNEIVAMDMWGAVFWVRAKTDRDILPGLDYELGANIYRIKKENPRSLYIVDFGGGRQSEELVKFKKYKASGVIVPRLRRALNDTLLGYKHTYFIVDSYDPKANEDRKKAEDKNKGDGYDSLRFY